ncbi:uncharacterized protein L969DRAFT_44672 [Mixia osmundae IAM 14324]|uniref:HTH cro/C1-type domain-containing protein n=1 Tax=Mixia osmundae (strain CBS 9802 / IAM 14324 / JCM 22182 / KY 12970) TaxID=764103 RepID=G7DYH3_MIXOS|nr:uncharacterized protein L969DRAFT_44672 [Mixia osmundae IAM 14324]KEI41534.1 hypothetical protein L969DRAFT_44672 [Mixia osmundae IAM 14324]GAA95633.1 hypothetical protein E5Q_02289 [Mixia osmundae IAM 14324]
MASLDWDSKTVIGSRTHGPKVAKDESTVNAARRTGAAIETDKRATGGVNRSAIGKAPDHQRIAKLDRENEVAPPATVSLDLAKLIAKSRADKGLTQKELAQKINEKSIGDYENGKAIPNVAVLGKMERILGVKLRGKDIGQPLQLGPKK